MPRGHRKNAAPYRQLWAARNSYKRGGGLGGGAMDGGVDMVVPSPPTTTATSGGNHIIQGPFPHAYTHIPLIPAIPFNYSRKLRPITQHTPSLFTPSHTLFFSLGLPICVIKLYEYWAGTVCSRTVKFDLNAPVVSPVV